MLEELEYRDQRQSPRRQSRLAAHRVDGGEVGVAIERAELVAQSHDDCALGEGGAGDADGLGGDVADRLQTLSRRKAWDEMASLIDDDMLNTFALVAPADELADALKRRYRGLVDRLSIYRPFVPDERDGFWRDLVAAMREA